MKMMNWADGEDVTCVQWFEDGNSFVINHPVAFTRDVVSRFFKPTKFSSFTRKLYRWGFRQVNRNIGPDDPIIFGNDFFQRDHKELLCKMKSLTAACTRKERGNALAAIKHDLVLPHSAHQMAKKRMMMINQLGHQKADMFGIAQQNQGLHFPLSTNDQLSLTNAMRSGEMGGFLGNQQDLMQLWQFHQSGMEDSMLLHASDNMHQQFLLHLHQMQDLSREGYQGQEGLSCVRNQSQQQQLQQQHLSFQMHQQQFSQLDVSLSSLWQMEGNMLGQQGGYLYDYIAQNAPSFIM